jgi:fructoselysine-6-P-deglycase FrlB-like protein
MTTDIIPGEIADGPAAIRRTVAEARPGARDIAARLRRDGIRRIHVIGNGTSYHSSLAAATLYGRHARAGDPIVVPMTAGAFLTYPPVLDAGDAIVGISSRLRRRCATGCRSSGSSTCRARR